MKCSQFKDHWKDENRRMYLKSLKSVFDNKKIQNKIAILETAPDIALEPGLWEEKHALTDRVRKSTLKQTECAKVCSNRQSVQEHTITDSVRKGML